MCNLIISMIFLSKIMDINIIEPDFSLISNSTSNTDQHSKIRIDKYEVKPIVIGLGKTKIPVNSKCPCGSGHKFKKCCFDKNTNNGTITTKCRFCNCNIMSFSHEDYLDHVEDDQITLIESIKSLRSNQPSEENDIRTIEDLNLNYEPSKELENNIKRRLALVEDIDRYIKEQRKNYPYKDF